MRKFILFIIPLFGLFSCNSNPTPAHQHEWSNWESISETEHKRVCATCNEFETKDHEFGEPKTVGLKKIYTCSVCNYKKTEAISGVTVKGIAGMDDVFYPTLDDAYNNGKEILSQNGGLYGETLDEEKFKALFTDCMTN